MPTSRFHWGALVTLLVAPPLAAQAQPAERRGGGLGALRTAIPGGSPSVVSRRPKPVSTEEHEVLEGLRLAREAVAVLAARITGVSKGDVTQKLSGRTNSNDPNVPRGASKARHQTLGVAQRQRRKPPRAALQAGRTFEDRSATSSQRRGGAGLHQGSMNAIRNIRAAPAPNPGSGSVGGPATRPDPEPAPEPAREGGVEPAPAPAPAPASDPARRATRSSATSDAASARP